MHSKKEVLETWFQKVWTEEDASVIHKMFVPETPEDAAYGLQKEGGMGPDDYLAFHQALLALIIDVHLSIDYHMEQGDMLIAQCTVHANDRKHKSPVSMKGCVIVKIVDGKIVTAENHFDFLNFFEALGLLPTDTFSKCISGNKVA